MRNKRITYSVINISDNSEWKWCYSAKELQEELNILFTNQSIKSIFVQLYGYLASHHSKNYIDLSCEAGGCIVVFDKSIIELEIHAEGQINYRFLSINNVEIKTVKDYPPKDYDTLINSYFDIVNHDISIDIINKRVTGFDVIGTDMWCFSLKSFNNDLAKIASLKHDLPAEIDINTTEAKIRLIGDCIEYFRVIIEEKQSSYK